jgi:hypothetical protein
VSYPGCAAHSVTNSMGSRTPDILQVVVVIMARLNPRIRCTGLGARCLNLNPALNQTGPSYRFILEVCDFKTVLSLDSRHTALLLASSLRATSNVLSVRFNTHGRHPKTFGFDVAMPKVESRPEFAQDHESGLRSDRGPVVLFHFS